MYIINNVTQACQIKALSNEALIISKNYISNIAIRILKYSPLIIGMIQIGIIFSLAHPIESAVLRDQTSTSTTTPELDEIIIVAITRKPVMICGTFASLC